MLVANGSQRVPPKSIKIFSSGQWREPKESWIRVDGNWKQLVPSNAVVLYTNTSQFIDRAYIADGTNGTENLIGYFPACSTFDKVLQTGGSLTHTGTDHGDNTALNSSLYTETRTTNEIFGGVNETNDGGSHNHYLLTHQHTGDASNLPSYSSLIPTMFGRKIYAGAILLAERELTSPWVQTALLDYIYLLSTSGHMVTPTHEHDSTTANSNTYNASYDQNHPDADPNYRSHYHTVSHKLAPLVPSPLYQEVLGYYSSQDFYLNDLSPGSVMIFTSNNLPNGWAQWCTGGELLKLVAGPILKGGGSRTHRHPQLTITTGISIVGTPISTDAGTNGSEFFVGSHSHTFYDIHQEAASMPPYKNFIIAYKIY